MSFFKFIFLFLLNSDLSDEWAADSLHWCHHEPVTRQRFPSFWVLFMGGQSGTRLQHHLHSWTLSDQPPIWRAGNLWWWGTGHINMHVCAKIGASPCASGGSMVVLYLSKCVNWWVIFNLYFKKYPDAPCAKSLRNMRAHTHRHTFEE